MRFLIIKLGATGDVVRTTPLLKRLKGEGVWLTEDKNTVLLEGLDERLRCFSWEDREAIPKVEYDLLINLEDTEEVGAFAGQFKARQRFGAYLGDNRLRYTDDARGWFDLSLISRYGREEADRLKFLNRSTYQELIFSGLGWRFEGEKYRLPSALETDRSGDVAIAPEAGPVWPMKNWAHYGELKKHLEDEGLRVNVLPRRASLLEHLGDVCKHRCFVGGDSLPMHFALGTGTPCVSLFTCTSPWEIHDYGVQNKLISPLLGEFFYKRGYDQRATTVFTVDEVAEAVRRALRNDVERQTSDAATALSSFSR